MNEKLKDESGVLGTETPKEEIKEPTAPTTPEPSEVPEAPKSETPPAPEPKASSFHDMLKVGYITEGMKIAFTPKGGKEIEVVVDEAFLKLPIQEKEYYEEFNYKIVK